MATDRPTIQTVHALLLAFRKEVMGNGQPGIVQQLRAADDKNEELIEKRHGENVARMDKSDKKVGAIDKKVDRIMMFGFFLIVLVGLITGSGRVSLESLLKYLGK